MQMNQVYVVVPIKFEDREELLEEAIPIEHYLQPQSEVKSS